MSKGRSVRFVVLASAKSAAGELPRATCEIGANTLVAAATSCFFSDQAYGQYALKLKAR